MGLLGGVLGWSVDPDGVGEVEDLGRTGGSAQLPKPDFDESVLPSHSPITLTGQRPGVEPDLLSTLARKDSNLHRAP